MKIRCEVYLPDEIERALFALTLDRPELPEIGSTIEADIRDPETKVEVLDGRRPEGTLLLDVFDAEYNEKGGWNMLCTI